MQIKKRNNTLEKLNLNKIYNSILSHCDNLENVKPLDVAKKAIAGIKDNSTTKEIDLLSIQVAANLTSVDPNYSKLSAKLLSSYIEKEVFNLGIKSFTKSIEEGYKHNLLSKEILDFVKSDKEFFNNLINTSNNDLFDFFGLKILFDRYLIRHPISKYVIETPQYLFLRVACGLNANVANKAIAKRDVARFYKLISSLKYLPSTPTLFNSGSQRSQMSSCYLLDSPEDSLEKIYDKYKDVALLSKFAGGIGLSYSKVRGRGSLIKGTNGESSGIIPWLKVLDSSVTAVNQGGKRKGAACVYLESWHTDIEEFLELKNNTGDESLRAHNLNLANWIPDLFMERVRSDEQWTLFSPEDVEGLADSYGDEFKKRYLQAEEDGLGRKKLKARELYKKMLITIAQTGNGWMCFKDSSNEKCNQTGTDESNVVHLSNLCTEIIEVTSPEETAVCNLGSINLSEFVMKKGKNGLTVDYEELSKTVEIAVEHLDKVININFYPIKESASSNEGWRPVGLGTMGLQDLFFKLGVDFDSEKALEISTNIAEEIYYTALETSSKLAEKNGSYPKYDLSKTAKGILQFDLWDNPEQPKRRKDWGKLRKEIKRTGLRNSLLIAIAPTATIASIAGCYECIEPQASNLFKRETLSGDFLQINKYLVRDLQKYGLWNKKIKDAIILDNGSIQNISNIPLKLRKLYKTAWEIPMKSLIDIAVARAPYIDQSQSLNLFVANPTIEKLSSMYMYVWETGLKTTYYLRSKAAMNIQQIGLENDNVIKPEGSVTQEEAIVCYLENPESCESCT